MKFVTLFFFVEAGCAFIKEILMFVIMRIGLCICYYELYYDIPRYSGTLSRSNATKRPDVRAHFQN